MAQRDEITAAFNSPIFTDAVGATPPDEASRKLSLQNKTGIPAGLIQPAHEEMDQRAQITAAFDSLATEAPKTAAWGSQSPYHASLIKENAASAKKLESSFLGKVEAATTGAWVAAGSMVPRLGAGLLGAERMFADLFITPWARAAQRAIGVSEYDIGAALTPSQPKYAKLSEELAGVATEKLVEGGVPESIAPGVTSGFQMVGQIAQVLAAPATVLPTMGITTTGESYAQAREKGLDPVKAAYFATGQGAIEVATESFAMGGLIKAAQAGSPLAKAAIGMVAKEIPGEQIATASQDLLEAAMLTPEKPISEYLAERPDAALQTLVATLVGGGGMATVAAVTDKLNKVVSRNAQSLAQANAAQAPEQQRAEGAAQVFASLAQAAEAAQQNTLRKHSKEIFHEYVSNITEGSDLATVHVDAKALSAILSQQKPEIVNAIFTALPELTTDLQVATATDGTVTITAADLLTHFDDPAMQKELLNIVRATPDGMNYNESQAFYQTQTQELEKQASALAEEAAPVLQREEYEAAQQTQATPAELEQRTAARIEELAAIPEEAITPEQAQELLALTTSDAQAQAAHFGMELVQDKPTYPQYLKSRGDKAAVRAAEVENLRRTVIEGMRAMNTFTESAIQAYATPLVEMYQVSSAKMGLLPSELMSEVPLKFLAESMAGVNPQANAKASQEDFTGENVQDILRKTDWSIMTAENPKAKGVLDEIRSEQTGDRRGWGARGSVAPLEGAPAVRGFNGPDPRLVAVAEKYAAEKGINLKRQAEYVEVDEERAKRIAAAYEAMEHAPNDPKVAEAYDNLIAQALEQYQALVDAGYKFWFNDVSRQDNLDYLSTPWNAMRDLRENQSMGVFPTEEGFGTSEFDPAGNPLLRDTGIEWPVGSVDGTQTKRVLANDIFRAVHDAFGHGLEGTGFRARGEENAWQAHVRLFTGSAVGALTSETRGQNSWLNYGPHGEANQTAKVEDTVFADQKTGLMPEWTWTEGLAADEQTVRLNAEENAARNAAMRADLEAAGYTVIPVTGVYDRPDEKSFIVLGIPEEEALAIGQKYEQDSVITREGFVYHDGMYTEALGVTVHDTAPEAYFTTLPDGTMFTIGMEMDADYNFVKKPRGPRDPLAERMVLAQAAERIAENEAPEGPLSAQDTKDLRRLWEMYSLGEGTATQYGAPTPEAAKAANAGDVADAMSAMQRIFDAVYEGTNAAPAMKDVSAIFEGDRFPKGQGYAIAFSKTVSVDGKNKSRTGEIYVDMSDKTIQINVSQWGEGGRGAALYKSVFEFARANGFKFIGDTAGISVAGIKRRLENMLSHAIQTNDVSYMALHPKQISFIEKETGVKIQWFANGAEKTIEQMLNASYNLAIKDTPEVRHVYFDFARNLFVDSRTGRTAAGVAGLVTPPAGDADVLARKGKAGSSTLARTALSVSLLRARSPEDRHLVLREAARFSMAGLPGAERLLYQKTGGAPVEETAYDKSLAPSGYLYHTTTEGESVRRNGLRSAGFEMAYDPDTGEYLDTGEIDEARQVVWFSPDEDTALAQGGATLRVRAGIAAGFGELRDGTEDFAGAGVYVESPGAFSIPSSLLEVKAPNGEWVPAAPPQRAEREGAVSVIGHHFSNARRPLLDGAKYGTGLRGEEARRVAGSEDARLRLRVHFYVDEGRGVFPEVGVGHEEHIVQLDNLYDGANNPLRFPSRDANEFESAVLDAGFDGYYVEAGFGRQGVAVLLGKASRGVVTEGGAKQVEAAANRTVERELDRLVAEYIAQNTQQGTAIVDTDAARELFPDYAASNAARTRFSSAVHVASSKVSNEVYRRKLAEEPAEGKLPLVVFTAGGGGSGKSSARAVFGAQYEQAQIVYDSTMSKYDSAKRRIEEALAAGKDVSINFVVRDPLAAWVDGVLPRAMQDGRIVPLYAHASAHRGAAAVIKKLAAEYEGNHRVGITVIENFGSRSDIALGSVDSLASVNYNDLEARLYEALDKEFQNGKISRQVYEAAKAHSRGVQEPDAGAAQGVERGAGAGGYFQSQEVDQVITKPAFYSVLTQQVEKHQQKKGTPQQWIDVLNVMAKKGVVKAEEVEYTGVLDWLESLKEAKPHAALYDADGKLVATSTNITAVPPEGGRSVVVDFSKTIPREALVDYLRKNAVVINPVVRSGMEEEDAEADISFGQWETEEPDEDYLMKNARSYLDDDARQEYADRNDIPLEEVDDEDVLKELYDREERWYWEDSDAPQNVSITATLPSGKEINLTGEMAYGGARLYDSSRGEYAEVNSRYLEESDVLEYLREQYPEDFATAGEGGAAKWEQYSLRGDRSEYQERLLLNESHKGTPFEYNTHFEEENIAAFTRSNTRYVPLETISATHPELAERLRAEGKTQAKVLFAEEIQSDWAQQGRDKKQVYERVPYTLDMLTLDEENESKYEAMRATARANILDMNGLSELHRFVAAEILPSGDVVRQFTGPTPEDVLRQIDAPHGRMRIKASDGQEFSIARSEYASPEAAMQYIVDTKTFSRVKEEFTQFELDAKREALKKEIDAVIVQRREATGLHGVRYEVRAGEAEPTPEEKRWLELNERARELENELEALPRGIAPAAYVTKTDSWVALAVKDLIRHGAENDFDLVSWTTGNQQTARWSGGLRKRVDAIEWEKTAQGVIHIKAMQRGNPVGDTRYSENDLTAAIGKTMADRIINDPNPSGTIEGDDIVVADLGMVKFYGDADGNDPSGNPAIVTKVTNNVLKKLGANVKVRSALMSTTQTRAPEVHAEAHPHYQPSFEITPELKAMAMQGMPLFQKKLAYFDPDQMMIAMLKGANLSSMIHESGHFYLEALAKMSSHPKATQQMKDDFDKALKWFGIPDRKTWEAMSLDQKRPFHEQWAQSFERWTLEGRAPTVEMQPVFARFRAWMLSVYKSLEQFLQKNPLAGKLNDEVRGVFSRLIAAEDAIKAAEEARAFTAMAKPEGVSEEEYAKYLELGEEATQDAISNMQTRTLRDMKWLSNAKHKAIRKLQREAAAKRKAIREEVTKEVMAEPVNQARTFLTKGSINRDGEEIQVAVGHKLDSATLQEMYPRTMLARPDLTKLRGMTGEGLDPDTVAGMFGFASGDALVRELIDAEPAKDKIDGMTDQRMLEQHGELIDAEGIERAAEAAIHNEARARFLATGLTMLTKSPAPARELAKAAKEAAANVIARKKVRDIRPKQFSAAEARANKKALELAPKSPAEAADAQRAALLNNRLAAAATEALDEVDKALRLAEKFKSDGVRKNLDIEYLEQIDDLLNGFDFRKGQSLKAIDKRRSFAEFVALQEERGFEPIVSADQMEAMSRKHYKDMTMEELRGLVDAVKHLEHLARLKKKLLTAKDEREFAQRIAEAVQSIEANANRTVEERATPSDVAGRAAQLWRGFAAEHRKVASIVREMDGSKDGGVMWDLLIRPMNEAGDNETEMRALAAEKMGALFAPIREKMGGVKGHLKVKRTVVPGTKLSMSYEERVMFALNWGNEGNRQRLLDGGLTGKRSLTEEEAQAIIGTLDKQDWDFVQGVWDYLDTFRPAVAEMERDLTGKEPQWVEASPIETKFGTYRGGYFPAKYDAELSTRSESLEAAATLRMGMKGAFGNAGTRNGYTQKRAEQVVDRPILLSFNVISQHVSEVTHRLAWQRWVVDANRVLRSLDGAVRDYYGPEILREMKKLVEDIAAGDAGAANVIERVINHLRTGSTIVGMGWRVTTALLQPSGLAQSWVRIGGKWTAMGVKQYLKNPIATTEMVNARSKLMRDRGRTMQREINEILNTVRVGDKVSNVQASYFWMIAKLQRTVDVPTWLGAYEKAVAQLGLENAASEKERAEIEDKAAAMADQAVLDAQSGGQLKDLARVQRGSPIFKLFTNFYSYFSATYNLNVEAYRRTSFKDPAQVGQFAVDMLMLNTVPVLFSVALKEMLKGGCDNDDVECLLGKVGKEQVNFMFGQMILLREAGAAAGALTGDAFGYSGPAGLRFFSDLYKAGQQVGQGEADFAAWKAVTNTLAVPLHLPMGQVNATLEGIIEIEKGNVEGGGILPALIAGKERKE